MSVEGVLRVLEVQTFASWQDRGRVGVAHLGVPRGGAFDAPAAALANRLVGNCAAAPVIEVLLGGLTVTFSVATWLAVTGAQVPVRVAGRLRAHGAAVLVPAGVPVELGVARSGLRAYLALRGTVATSVVFGSHSHDTLAGLGPEPLRAGQEWRYLTRRGAPVALDTGPFSERTSAREALAPLIPELRLIPGPQWHWFADPARVRERTWRVSSTSDRIGVRLAADGGEGLARNSAFEGVEMESEPMVLGAVQVPPSGELVVFGPDHPITGGYPVLAVVVGRDLARLAQARPGDSVSLML